MMFMVLGRGLGLFTGDLLQMLSMQAASRYRPIAFDPEGSSLDHCLPVNNLASPVGPGKKMLSASIRVSPIILVLVFLLVSPARAEKIRTAVPGLNLNYLSVFAAEERKFFWDEGLENETIVIGGPAGIAALVSGDVDYSGAGGSGLRAAVKGAPLKAILYQTERPTWYLIVHPSITQTSDLKGKKIGVALIGDSEDRFTTLFVERGGLSAKDVTKISLGTNPGDKILALKSGGISAVVLDPAATVMAEREGLRSLAYLGDVFPLPFQGYVTTHRKIAANPTQVKRWIRAMVRSLMFLRERPEEATEVAMKRLRFRNITKPMLTEAIKSYVRAFPQGVPGMPSPEGVKGILEYEVRLPMKMEESVPPEKFLDLRWVEEVKKELEQKSASK
jgi:ABC-type nitrate/sulfonate/bicarbonate transport system substrate-binding protein